MAQFRKVVTLVLALALPGAGAGAETLTDALIAAYQNSSLLAQNEALLRAADEDVAAAVARMRPVLDFTARHEWSKAPVSFLRPESEMVSTSLTLSAGMMLYDGGRSRMGRDAAREAVLAAGQGLVLVEQDVLLAAISAYVDMGLQNRIVALRQSNVRLITEQLRAAKDRFEVGEITRTDVAVAEARLAAARAGLSAAEGAAMMARERYKAAVGQDPGTLATLPAIPALPDGMDAGRALALKSHPMILQTQHQVAAADLGVQIAKAGMGPTLSASASATDLGDGIYNESVGVTLNQRLYGGGGNASAYRQAIANQEAARAGLHQVGLIVSENVGRAWAGLAVATATIEANRRQVEAAQAAFDGVREEADLGARTTIDVLNAEQELLSARAALAEAEANRYVASYQVLAASGLLTVEHLGLGIPTYDPEAYYNAVKSAPAKTSAQGQKLDRVMSKLSE